MLADVQKLKHNCAGKKIEECDEEIKKPQQNHCQLTQCWKQI